MSDVGFDYKGDVIYRGVKYAGSHEPLVAPEVWYQVQNVLMAHNTAGDRTQRHDHYLKGTLYCGSCGSRLVISNAKSRSGNIYPYFVCAGRHRKRTPCTRSAVLLDDAERLVIDYYQANIQIPAHIREQLRGMLAAEFDHLLAASETELSELAARRDQLEGEQTKLIHGYYADAITLPALKREQDRISSELEYVNSRIEVFHGDYADARAELARPFGILLDPNIQSRAHTWSDDPATYAGSLNTREPISLVPGLNFGAGVPPAGIEPASHA